MLMEIQILSDWSPRDGMGLSIPITISTFASGSLSTKCHLQERALPLLYNFFGLH
jgi:hypothetical protein